VLDDAAFLLESFPKTFFFGVGEETVVLMAYWDR